MARHPNPISGCPRYRLLDAQPTPHAIHAPPAHVYVIFCALCRTFTWPSYVHAKKKYPVAFFNVVGGDTEGQGESKSFFNADEASVTLQLMLAVGQDPKVESIAILVPYKGQVRPSSCMICIRPCCETQTQGAWAGVHR